MDHHTDIASKDPMDVIQVLKEAVSNEPNTWSKDAQIDEILTLLLAGHETTANTLAWALVETAKAGLTPLSPDSVDHVILETLRLHPPAWVLPRQVASDITIDGVCLRKGTNLIISPYLYHRSPQYFPNPDVFDPSRWVGIHLKDAPDSFLPFGIGNRGCIGQRFAMTEMRQFLKAFSMTGKWSLENEIPREQFLLTLRPSDQPRLVRHH